MVETRLEDADNASGCNPPAYRYANEPLDQPPFVVLIETAAIAYLAPAQQGHCRNRRICEAARFVRGVDLLRAHIHRAQSTTSFLDG